MGRYFVKIGHGIDEELLYTENTCEDAVCSVFTKEEFVNFVLPNFDDELREFCEENIEEIYVEEYNGWDLLFTVDAIRGDSSDIYSMCIEYGVDYSCLGPELDGEALARELHKLNKSGDEHVLYEFRCDKDKKDYIDRVREFTF